MKKIFLIAFLFIGFVASAQSFKFNLPGDALTLTFDGKNGKLVNGDNVYFEGPMGVVIRDNHIIFYDLDSKDHIADVYASEKGKSFIIRMEYRWPGGFLIGDKWACPPAVYGETAYMTAGEKDFINNYNLLIRYMNRPAYIEL